MAIYTLFDEPVFPHPEEAEPDGLLAIGGDLSVPRLLAAYSNGIFPWYSENSPILWWSTDPRLVLFPKDLHISKSLRRVLNSGRFTVTINNDFSQVITACSQSVRPGQDGTWIVPEMVEAYKDLHRAGVAHSIEVSRKGKIVGGLYGVSIGRAFFGESMFFLEPDASKVAFVHLVRHLVQYDFLLIDCQQTTDHLLRFGAQEIVRPFFLELLAQATPHSVPPQCWERRSLCG